ncbi:NAD/NADP transhydrogenase alpha subunit [Rhizobium leucaenae]|uniref:NAD/NADP transhydrogenase alpha subunit n=1 Tax=Rhizobium leucaenae TaxID=29450 RepID=A0A7W6ZXK8_9HYPH|nr:NAD/NADP transhydrogenase alpha subunit [Rhizobium leucaenae]
MVNIAGYRAVIKAGANIGLLHRQITAAGKVFGKGLCH